MIRMRLLLSGTLVGLAAPLAAQQVRPLSLEDALGLAIPASETLELARAAVSRARGEHVRAAAGRWPEFNATLGYTRLLKSQFEGFSFGDSVGTGEEGSDQLPFGQKNTFNLGLNVSWPLFSGGRVSGQVQAADASRRRADMGLTSAQAQVTLEVVQAYYNAAAADYNVRIGEILLQQADTTLRQTELRRSAGTQPEFDLLRARVARGNARTVLIARQVERDVSYLDLRRLLGIPMDQPVTLTTSLVDTASAAQVPTLMRILSTPTDTAIERRIVVRQAAEAVTAEEGLARATKSDRWPQLVVNSAYGRVGYPGNIDPFAPQYFTNWDVSVGIRFPVFTGGRLRGNRMVADAGVQDARLRLRQVTELAQVDTRSALAQLGAAEAAWQASEGTVEQARRAYEIAQLRYTEGLSTQVELLDARQAQAQAESLRLEAARSLGIARVRVALLPALPVAATVGFTTTGSLPLPASTRQTGTSTTSTGTTP
ncbi:MAG TPA: TolC family protein [Gemmatimonadales bacterium]